MKVLFVDDMQIRFDRFQEKFKDECNEITYASTVEVAIDALKKEKFDCIFLDHDLGGQYFVPSGKNTGYEIAEWIGNNMDYKPIIIIHSMNPIGGVNMHRILQETGFSPILCPFTCLMGNFA